jgi:GrpB-like predicted nucleotidyltransferase (UPF0157 family)
MRDERGLTTEEYMRAVTIGDRTPLHGPVELVEYDAAWPEQYRREEARIRGALGERALVLEHVGSTAVPGLPAKPVIDIVLGVADSTDEAAYLPDLERAGYTLRIREPDWHEHRLLKDTGPNVHLHVFSVGCAEIERMTRFRDHLRRSDDDRELYERMKRALAMQTWEHTQHYADAKDKVVAGIMARTRR